METDGTASRLSRRSRFTRSFMRSSGMNLETVRSQSLDHGLDLVLARRSVVDLGAVLPQASRLVDADGVIRQNKERVGVGQCVDERGHGLEIPIAIVESGDQWKPDPDGRALLAQSLQIFKDGLIVDSRVALVRFGVQVFEVIEQHIGQSRDFSDDLL